MFADQEWLINLVVINESLTEVPLSEMLDRGLFADSAVGLNLGPSTRQAI